VTIKQQPAAPATAIDCFLAFDTFCGNPNSGFYWNHSTGTVSWLGYSVEPSGFVQFQGTAVRVGSAGNVVFHLPPGHRPSATVAFSVPRTDTCVEGSCSQDALWIDSFGTVFVVGTDSATAGASFDLSGVRFRIGG